MVSESGVEDLFRKLKALAENKGATPAEAATAAAKMNDLLVKYNLDVSQLDLSRGEEPVFEQKEATTRVADEPFKWAVKLASVVSYYNFTAMIYWGPTPSAAGKIVFVGRRHNVQVSEYLFDYLFGEVKRLTRESWAKEGKHTGAWRNVWVRNFSFGCVDSINIKLDQRRRQQMSGGGDMRALVDASRAELDEVVSEMFGTTKKKKPSAPTGKGYENGRAARETIDIHDSVNRDQVKPQLNP